MTPQPSVFGTLRAYFRACRVGGASGEALGKRDGCTYRTQGNRARPGTGPSVGAQCIAPDCTHNMGALAVCGLCSTLSVHNVQLHSLGKGWVGGSW